MAEVDLVVLCLPDDAAKESSALAASLGNAAPKLLDASTAHRVNPDWVYGFAEMLPGQDKRIAEAKQVANPGCYPTGAIGLLRPLVDAGLIPQDHPITINAVSGYSGGGKSMIQAHDTDHGPAFSSTLWDWNTNTCRRPQLLRRPGKAADFRSLSGTFPPGHAGFGAAPSRYATGPTYRSGPARGSGKCYAGCDLVRVVSPPQGRQAGAGGL